MSAGASGTWAGWAVEGSRTRAGTVSGNGVNRGIYRLSGQSRFFVVERVNAATWSADNVNRTRNTTTHEMGHSLGYWGHAPGSADVMFRSNHARHVLGSDEARYLRIIYGHFR